jgi:hypothetical protein
MVQPQRSASITDFVTRGEWPSEVSDLPLMLTEHQLAHLRGKSVRTLQREPQWGRSPPFFRDGRKILYPRAGVVAHYMAGSA